MNLCHSFYLSLASTSKQLALIALRWGATRRCVPPTAKLGAQELIGDRRDDVASGEVIYLSMYIYILYTYT